MEKDVPYIVFESEVARFERTIKRLVILLAISIGLLFASNLAWIAFICQYDITDTVVTQDSENASYIGRDGTVINGNAED